MSFSGMSLPCDKMPFNEEECKTCPDPCPAELIKRHEDLYEDCLRTVEKDQCPTYGGCDACPIMEEAKRRGGKGARKLKCECGFIIELSPDVTLEGGVNAPCPNCKRLTVWALE